MRLSRPRARAALAGVAVLAVATAFAQSARAQQPTTPFAGTYASERSSWWHARDCGGSAGFSGRQPATGSGHPVFVYLPGTSEPHDGPMAATFVSAMAARGFVAAAVAYADWQFHAAGLEGNARCIYGGDPGSAVSQLCARPAADCSRGIVVAGFSQGATIAARAANHSSAVRAAYLLGFNEERSSPLEGTARWSMAVAPPAGTRALPDDRIRIVDGLADAPVERRDELDDQTGRRCPPAAARCLGADGSGWYVVQDDEVADGLAEHCYFHGPYFCPRDPSFDPTWLRSTTAPWALQPALAWLQSFTG